VTTPPPRRRRSRDVSAVMLPLCAIAVDVGRLYVEIQRVQNAADAAALAGVTFLPDDLALAETTAARVSGSNGYPDSGDSTVTAEVGSKPTQLRVTVSSTIPNSFASALGFEFATVSRSSVADFNGPAPMGSPCNAFGNEPPAGSAPTGSQIVLPAGGAECTSTPRFWGAIAGPETPKGSGDARMTRTCASGTSGCVSGKNTDFDPLGYFYLVRVGAAAANRPVTLELYDPSFVETGDVCEAGPNVPTSPAGPTFINNMNPHASTDGIERYRKTTNAFCAGDVLTSTSSVAPTTSFALRGPTETYRPVRGTPITGCAKQYRGYKKADATSATLRAKLDNGTDNPSYNPDLAQVFHQWVPMCTFTPTAAGDYYLQVRTNVALPTGAPKDGNGGYVASSAVTTQLTDDTAVKGNGNNRFAIRATGSARGAVAISGWEAMSIYANFPSGATSFNMVRALPSAASKSLTINLFDIGDATGTGTLTVLPPLDSNLPASLQGCTGTGVKNGALTNCSLTDVKSSTYNTKNQTIRVPIPASYTCSSTQPGGCWFRLSIDFTAQRTDTTTWTARVVGDPVRLIE
jgi:hypothetical protein